MVAERLTVPLKPFVPLTVIVKLVEEPLAIDSDDGFEVMVKSGGGGGAPTVTRTVTEWDSAPEVPVTFTV